MEVGVPPDAMVFKYAADALFYIDDSGWRFGGFRTWLLAAEAVKSFAETTFAPYLFRSDFRISGRWGMSIYNGPYAIYLRIPAGRDAVFCMASGLIDCPWEIGRAIFWRLV